MSNGTKLIQDFPLSGTRIIRVPAAPKGSVDPAFVSYHIGATEVDVNIVSVDSDLPNLGWTPIAAISVLPIGVGITCNCGEVIVNDSLRNVSFWLSAMNEIGNTSGIPAVDYQVRATSGNCTPEVIGSGQIKLTSYAQKGLICQASGWLCNQFEFWARITSGSDQVSLVLDINADRFVGCPREFYKGSCGT